MNVQMLWFPKTTVHLISRVHLDALRVQLHDSRKRVVVCDAALWKCERDGLLALASALRFQPEFGLNWDAFFDSFSDSVPDHESFALVIHGVRAFAATSLEAALRTVHHLAELSEPHAELRVFYVE